MVLFQEVLSIHIKVVDADWMVVLSELYIIQVCALLIQVVNSNHVVNNLN